MDFVIFVGLLFRVSSVSCWVALLLICSVLVSRYNAFGLGLGGGTE